MTLYAELMRWLMIVAAAIAIAFVIVTKLAGF
jgi:hypothetical protein